MIGFKPTYGCILTHGISLKSEALDACAFLVKEYQYLSRIGQMLDLPGQSTWKGDVVKICFATDLFNEWMQADGKEMVYAAMKAATNWAGQDQVEEADLSEFLSGYAKGWEQFDGDNVYEALRSVASTIAKYELKLKQHKDNNIAVEDHPVKKQLCALSRKTPVYKRVGRAGEVSSGTRGSTRHSGSIQAGTQGEQSFDVSNSAPSSSRAKCRGIRAAAVRGRSASPASSG